MAAPEIFPFWSNWISTNLPKRLGNKIKESHKLGGKIESSDK